MFVFQMAGVFFFEKFWHPSSAPVGLANPTGLTVWICQSTPSMKDAKIFMPDTVFDMKTRSAC